jgi:hypothetical protein
MSEGLEKDTPMTKPVAQLSQQEYDAERADIARERAALAKQRAALTNGDYLLTNGNGDTPRTLGALTDDDAFNAPMHIVEPQEPEELTDDATPAPWPHETKILDDGYVLEYRKPDSSALIAISMVGMDGFDAGQQMNIFNKFMAKHLSMNGLSYVLGRMADPDDGFGLGELISTLTADE